jgi:hypothetical protein
MRLSKPVKIIIGLLTAWVVISPFLYFGVWFFFIFGIATVNNQVQNNPAFLPAIFFPVFFLVTCSSIMQIGLQAFYIGHIILNKTGGDVTRVVLGVGIFLFAIIALPVYYFIYIFPDNPPQWALATHSDQPVGVTPTNTPST